LSSTCAEDGIAAGRNVAANSDNIEQNCLSAKQGQRHCFGFDGKMARLPVVRTELF
jgi:hypothetical protein